MTGAAKFSRRKRTPRFVEIAEAAGVSLATVDRVLNERGSVSAATRVRVVAAARQLGVPRILPDMHRGLIHVDVLLPQNSTPFFARLNLALQRSMQMLDKRVVIHRLLLPEADDEAITEAILRPRYKRSGLIVTTRDTARVRDALRVVIERGEQVVTMATDVVDVARLHYAGIDNLCAGRTAGYFVGRLARTSGRVLLLSSRTDYRSHTDRIDGCRAQIAESFPELVADRVEAETQDDPDKCYRAVVNAFKQGDVVGIYNSGYGSVGVEAALRKFDMSRRVVWVSHEMLDLHRQYIEEGTMDLAIDQDPDGQVISALQHVLHACGVVEDTPPAGAVEFRIFCSPNVRHSQYLPSSG
jgi:LacI family transcriptional regulator